MIGDRLRVAASVAGGAVAGELDGAGTVRIALRDGVWHDREALERHLEALGRRLWAARTRAYLAAVSAASGAPVTREPPAVGRRELEYVVRRAAVVACGRSADGRVSVRVKGMREWRVRVEPGPGDPSEAVREAGEALVRDQLRQVRALKRTIWHPRGTAIAGPAAESGGHIPPAGGAS